MLLHQPVYHIHARATHPPCIVSLYYPLIHQTIEIIQENYINSRHFPHPPPFFIHCLCFQRRRVNSTDIIICSMVPFLQPLVGCRRGEGLARDKLSVREYETAATACSGCCWLTVAPRRYSVLSRPGNSVYAYVLRVGSTTLPACLSATLPRFRTGDVHGETSPPDPGFHY